jgi:hypothetical protein
MPRMAIFSEYIHLPTWVFFPITRKDYVGLVDV